MLLKETISGVAKCGSNSVLESNLTDSSGRQSVVATEHTARDDEDEDEEPSLTGECVGVDMCVPEISNRQSEDNPARVTSNIKLKLHI
jgi:hypothetical protein